MQTEESWFMSKIQEWQKNNKNQQYLQHLQTSKKQ